MMQDEFFSTRIDEKRFLTIDSSFVRNNVVYLEFTFPFTWLNLRKRVSLETLSSFATREGKRIV